MSYLSQYKKYLGDKSKYSALKKQYDILLPPVRPEFVMTRASSNWGYSYMRTGEYTETITDKNPSYRKVFIIVIDTGAISRSKYLTKGFVNIGANFSDDPTPYDEHGHFSHVASSIVGAHPDGNMGMLNHPKLSEDFYEWTGIKILNKNGGGSFADMAKGLEHAYSIGIPYIDRGYAVLINLSVGGFGWDNSADIILKKLEAAGFFIVAAAGNSGDKGVNFPGSHPSTIAVGAFDKVGNIAGFSSIGETVDVAAPGVSIWGADHTETGTMIISGTSMATPHQVGALALLLAANPGIKTREQLIPFINSYITDIALPGEDVYSGMGATILHKYPVGEDIPNPPPSSVPAPPRKSVRRLHLAIDGLFVSTVYKGSSEEFSELAINISPVLTTKLYAEEAFDRLSAVSKEIMTGRGYYFDSPYVDIDDIAYWAAYFYEILFKREGFDVKVDTIEVTDVEGHRVIRKQPTSSSRPKIKARFINTSTKKTVYAG